jgi:hypothetical protein
MFRVTPEGVWYGPRGSSVDELRPLVLRPSKDTCRLCGLPGPQLTRYIFGEHVPFHRLCWDRWRKGERNER